MTRFLHAVLFVALVCLVKGDLLEELEDEVIFFMCRLEHLSSFTDHL